MFRSVIQQRSQFHSFLYRVKDSYRFYSTNDNNESTSETQSKWEPQADTGKYRGLIPWKKLEISYSTSSAPGGQNVNKNLTRAEVRFRIDECDWIESSIRDRFFEQHKNRITNDGYFVLRSERTRSQSYNVTDCLDKLRSWIRQCKKELEAEEAAKPTEEELQIMQKRQEAADRRRIREKRIASERRREKRTDYFD